MKTPFRLRKTTPMPAAALLLIDTDVGTLLRLCAQLGGPSLPVIHALAGGFLIRLPQPDEKAYPGVIRLRALSANLLVPVDADLTPSLLEDESTALVRQRGLIFMPGGGVLEFSPTTRLTPSDLLAVPRSSGHSWKSLPERPSYPEQLSEIVLDIPDAPPEAIIEAGGEGIGQEAPEPSSSGPVQTLAGSAAARLGEGLVRLGEAIGWKGLASMGARLMARAIQAVPRITERLLGKQEAALRELLRQFREGNTEEALKRALPLNPPGGRGTVPAQDANLPRHNLVYRLSELLRGGNESSSIWMGAGNVFHDLEDAYRKAAEDAARRGDHRRAAFIYGKLLKDWRAAAVVLSRGGLHHDAGVLYLEKLGETALAARCFELAGEIDRALSLYLQRGEHVEAGDLLMRSGEHERAREEYILAAEKEAALGHFLAAGNLAIQASRQDLKEQYFTTGWKRRPGGDSFACLMCLVDMHSSHSDDLSRLIGEADAYFAIGGNDQQAADFYNHLVELAGVAVHSKIRDDLIDRALLGLAAKLRQRAGDRGTAVSQLFGIAGKWEPALVRDAEVASRGLMRQEPARIEVQRMKTHAARVTAACSANQSGDVFVGFEDGVLARFDPRRGSCTTWQYSRFQDRVVAMATDARARALVVLEQREEGENRYRATSYSANETSYTLRNRFLLASDSVPSFSPVASSNGNLAVALCDGRQLIVFSLPDLLSIHHMDVVPEFAAAFLLDGWELSRASDSVFCVAGRMTTFSGASDPDFARRSDGKDNPATLYLPSFPPARIHESSSPMPSWLAPDRTHVEIAFVNEEGILHWLLLGVSGIQTAVMTQHQAEGKKYLCAALLEPGKVAGVHRDGVEWLTSGKRGFSHRSPTICSLPDAVACFASPVTHELVVVAAQGDAIRVRVPS